MMLSRDEQLTEIERAAVAAAWRRPDTIVVERPGWFQITTPSSNKRWHNGVVQSVMTADEVAARVDEVVEHYRARGSDFWWRVGPTAAPADLGAHLERHRMGFEVVVAMAADLDRLALDPVAGVTVEPMTAANVDDYVAASSAGWSNPAAADGMRVDLRRAIADEKHDRLYFIARVDGVPAGSGALLPVGERSGYLLGSSVVPAFRGRGVYRALVGERVALLRNRGARLVTIQAIAHTSAPICARLGFEQVCTTRIYTWYHRTESE